MSLSARIAREQLHVEQASALAAAVGSCSTARTERQPEPFVLDPARRSIRQLLIQMLIERDGERCYLCGEIVDEPCIEHIIPLSRDGENVPSNVALACTECNYQKALCFVSIRIDRRPRYHRR